MKSLTRLLGKILADARVWCSASTSRDFLTITTRIKHEGLSFLGITLPTFCNDFERSLADGLVDSNAFLGFRKRGALPRFLGGLLCQVFDSGTGRLLDSPSELAIHFIRQICLTCKKIEYTCSDARIRSVYEGYIETNSGVQEWESENSSWLLNQVDDPLSATAEMTYLVNPPEINHFNEVAGILWNSHTLGYSRWLPENLVPKHGPGATAEKISGNRKFDFATWHNRLEPYFPSDLFAIPSWNFVGKLDDMTYLDPEQETPVRVIHVPKTLKGPRVIAMEPVCMMYTQQALMRTLVPLLESSPEFSGALGFTDQTVNQEWARIASESGSYATIDLKDASDRVSAALVNQMLRNAPLFREAVFACRSTSAGVPGYGVVPLYRFASMGSGMCFPIEAMLFYTIAVSAISRATGNRITRASLTKISESVRVYGDDIIVPTEYALFVQSELERFNLRVNRNKTFDSGKFRESCGMDAYNGMRVTPVYARQMLPTARSNTKEMLSVVSMRNQFYEQGLWQTAAFLDEWIRDLIPFPNVDKTSPIIGRYSFLGRDEGTHFHPYYQTYMVKGLVVKSTQKKSVLDDFGALMKCFLHGGSENPVLDLLRGRQPHLPEGHLEYYGRPESVYTKIQWALPY